MPERKGPIRVGLALALAFLAACSHGKNDDHGSGPHTNIDLTVTGFNAVPGAADAEDILNLTGTIQNIGSETANPLQGDSFKLRFNLSIDGTFELHETGFLEQPITDPIPPGGSLSFNLNAPYGGGDTQSLFGNFCTSMGCVPPETGVLGVKVDADDTINELDEGNNFQFVSPFEVVGTRVAATFGGCDFGTPGQGDPGCNLTISDGLYTQTLHRPCSTCQSATDVILPNEIHRMINVNLTIKNCDRSQTPNGSCGGSWTITAETQKPGLPISKKQILMSCLAAYPNQSASCSTVMDIRDENY